MYRIKGHLVDIITKQDLLMAETKLRSFESKLSYFGLKVEIISLLELEGLTTDLTSILVL